MGLPKVLQESAYSVEEMANSAREPKAGWSGQCQPCGTD